MKLKFLAEVIKVTAQKDKGFKWVLDSGEDAKQEAAAGMAIVAVGSMEPRLVTITIEVED